MLEVINHDLSKVFEQVGKKLGLRQIITIFWADRWSLEHIKQALLVLSKLQWGPCNNKLSKTPIKSMKTIFETLLKLDKSLLKYPWNTLKALELPMKLEQSLWMILNHHSDCLGLYPIHDLRLNINATSKIH